MTRSIRHKFVAPLVFLALASAACASQPASVIASDASTFDDDGREAEGDPTSSEPTELPVADDSAPRQIEAPIPLPRPTTLQDLGGTIWAVASIDGKSYDDGWMSFRGREDRYIATYADECSAGLLGVRLEGDQMSVFSDAVGAVCADHPSGFLTSANELTVNATLDGYELTLAGSNHTLVALYEGSGPSVDEPPRIPLLPPIDLIEPDVEDLADVPEAKDLPVPECPSEGRLGLEDDPLAVERLATSQRLNLVVFELPFVVSSSGAGGNLYHHEMGIGLSVRYQPTLDWLAANVPEGHVCVEVPPVGFYKRGPSLLGWELVNEPSPNDSAILVRYTANCGPHEFLVMAPQVAMTDTEVQIGLPIRQVPYGQALDDMCRGREPFEVELPRPVGTRSVVPASQVTR